MAPADWLARPVALSEGLSSVFSTSLPEASLVSVNGVGS